MSLPHPEGFRRRGEPRPHGRRHPPCSPLRAPARGRVTAPVVPHDGTVGAAGSPGRGRIQSPAALLQARSPAIPCRGSSETPGVGGDIRRSRGRRCSERRWTEDSGACAPLCAHRGHVAPPVHGSVADRQNCIRRACRFSADGAGRSIVTRPARVTRPFQILYPVAKPLDLGDEHRNPPARIGLVGVLLEALQVRGAQRVVRCVHHVLTTSSRHPSEQGWCQATLTTSRGRPRL